MAIPPEFQIDHSMKDIPICSDEEYKETLTHQISRFLRDFRWYIYFKLKRELEIKEKDENGNDEETKDEETTDEETTEKETYGFRSSKAPPTLTKANYGDHVDSLKGFEDEIYSLVRKVKTLNHTNDYQDKLKGTVERIKSAEGLINPADKTYRTKTSHFAPLCSD